MCSWCPRVARPPPPRRRWSRQPTRPTACARRPSSPPCPQLLQPTIHAPSAPPTPPPSPGALRFGLGAVGPDAVLGVDGFARFEILVDLEEVLDLQLVERFQVGKVHQVRQARVGGRDAQYLWVRAFGVAHAEHAERPAADLAA